ncbi:MAG TPA: phosphate/phosphite/phosphonate ABC transporter substrate-binding protein [Candidatus Cloacimonadota bacterium]|nr:phosphate/phosphite/phosphonate ABC transporter substrate-binding protein [Candidatus Cloacimonadota bacterium]
MKKVSILICIIILLSIVVSCSKDAPLGSKQNPIKMYFVPSMEAGKIITSGEAISNYLHAKTGYYYKVAVPTSYAAVIEALGTNEADIAWLATFAYILAHQKYGAEVVLTTVRNGLKQYRGQFVAKSDSKMSSIDDIKGKTIAYTDAASTSGYIYPSAILKQKGIEPGKTYFAGSHPAAILAVYQGTADVAASFWSPPDINNIPQDSRKTIVETYPDVYQKIKIIGFTDWIPNDTVTLRKGLDPKMKEKIVAALLDFASSSTGQKELKDLYQIDGLVPATDADYDIVRTTLKSLGFDPEKMIQ